MQTITAYDGERGPAFEAFALLFSALSERPPPRSLSEGLVPHRWHPALLPWLGSLYQALGEEPPHMEASEAPPTRLRSVLKGRTLVAFSGGKDSLAAALMVPRHEHHLSLFHVHGLNRGYPRELERAEALAERLEVPLVVRTISISGAGAYAENPTKNFLLLAAMVEHGVRNGFDTYALGCDDHLGTTVNTTYNLSDAVELLRGLSRYYGEVAAPYSLALPIENGTAAYLTIAQRHPALFGLIGSCMMPEFRKPNVRKANAARGVALTDYQCGSCKKCAYEYIHGALLHLRPYTEEHLRRCVGILQRNASKNDSGPERVFTARDAVERFVDVPMLLRHPQDLDMGALATLQRIVEEAPPF